MSTIEPAPLEIFVRVTAHFVDDLLVHPTWNNSLKFSKECVDVTSFLFPLCFDELEFSLRHQPSVVALHRSNNVADVLLHFQGYRVCLYGFMTDV